jgi:hypothetical protein
MRFIVNIIFKWCVNYLHPQYLPFDTNAIYPWTNIRFNQAKSFYTFVYNGVHTTLIPHMIIGYLGTVFMFVFLFIRIIIQIKNCAGYQYMMFFIC